MRRRMRYILASMIMTLCLVTAFGSAAPAAESLDPDNDTGSVELTLRTEGGEAVLGIEISFYRIGTASYENYQLTYTSVSALGAETELNGLTAEENRTTAAALWSRIESSPEMGLSSWKAVTDSSGMILLSEMPMGVYLAVQTSESETYSDITPFLFYLPVSDETGWSLNAEIYPKIEVRTTPSSPTKPTTPTTPTTTTPSGSKLPQTGMLQWPIPVLAAAGVLLFAGGWCVNNKRKEK